MIHLKQHLFSILLLLTVVSCAQNKPNIILIMADDLGYGDVGFNGNTIIKTPHMDKMANEGLIFTNFYAGGPVCSPTRGTVLTGRHYSRYGIFSANIGHLPKEEITLQQLLKEKGYATGHFGKWHLGTLDKKISAKGAKRKPRLNYAPPWEHNFDESFVTESAVATWNPTIGSRYINNPYYHNGVVATENLSGDDSRVIMDRVIPFIKKASKSNQPFLSVIWFHTPHEPVKAGPEYKKMYSEYSEGKQNYYGAVTAMDDQIGRLQEILKKLNIDDNTIIWFCSDNGPEGKVASDKRPGSTGGLRGRKRSLYSGGVGVPAFVKWPKKVKPVTTTNFISGTLDYFPTLLDALGLVMPDNRPIDGVSLLPMLEEKETSRKQPLPFMHKGKAAWIQGDLKYVSKGGEIVEVYNLRTDRFEKNNVIAKYVEKVQEMNQHIMDWNLSCKKSHSGADYESVFKPVDKWKGIGTHKNKKG
jgi:arylsulfatase A-like enzyme